VKSYEYNSHIQGVFQSSILQIMCKVNMETLESKKWWPYHRSRSAERKEFNRAAMGEQ